MYTAQQVQTVINYNNTARIFNICSNKRITWDIRNMDVANLAQQNVHIVTQADYAALKQAVRTALKAQQLV